MFVNTETHSWLVCLIIFSRFRSKNLWVYQMNLIENTLKTLKVKCNPTRNYWLKFSKVIDFNLYSLQLNKNTYRPKAGFEFVHQSFRLVERFWKIKFSSHLLTICCLASILCRCSKHFAFESNWHLWQSRICVA